MIKAIIFDCFGVIVADALQLACDDLRTRDPEAADQIVDIVKATGRGYIDVSDSRRQVAELLGISVDEYYETITNNVIKDQQLLDYIVELRQSYKTALLSNVAKGSLELRFTPGELERHFDTVVASGDVGFAKPEPQIYEITADRLGVRFDECLFTDDREEYCQAARAVGMQAIVYQTYPQFKTELESRLIK